MKSNACPRFVGWFKPSFVPSFHLRSLPAHSIYCRSLSVNSAIAQGIRESRKHGDSRKRGEAQKHGVDQKMVPNFGGGVSRRRYKNVEPYTITYTTSMKQGRKNDADTASISNSPISNLSSEEVIPANDKIFKVNRNPRSEFGRLGKGRKSDDVVPISIPYSTAASVIIPGMRAVQAAFKAKRRKLYKLWVSESCKSKPEHVALREAANAANVQVVEASSAYLSRLKDQLAASGLVAKDGLPLLHDGVLLDASPLPQIPVKGLGFYTKYGEHLDLDLEAQSKEEAEVNGTSTRLSYNNYGWRQPFYVWLHEVVDTGNLGAILRTALYFAADGIILTKRGTAKVSDPGAQKASAGAAEFLPTLMVNDPFDFIKNSKAAGWLFFGAIAPPSDPAIRAQTLLSEPKHPLLRSPCVLVLGNEDQGLPRLLVQQMDHQVTIPTPNAALAAHTGVDSLNVSVAAALLIERFLRKPKPDLMRAFDAKNRNPMLRT